MNQFLKALMGWIATITLLALIAACSSTERPHNTTESTSTEHSSSQHSEETALKPSPLSLPKTIHDIDIPISIKDKNLDLEFKVNGIREHQGKGVIKPNQGQKWIVVSTTITNKGQTSQTISVVSFGLIDSKNNQYEVALLAGALDDVQSPTGQLSPDDEQQGEVAFEVPEGTKELKLLFKPNSINCEASASKQKSSETLNCEPIVVKLD
ncbi:DUF4352 domain-containing protein [Microcoleus sp. FACHB-SPT15]|uniref:DUF4352 domain-containing protein n=1 Tax=Microcoleus sp. FACHB-SPT15 TaxID=2692830 RepID=UPI0017818503|nr:DUF4352 domain-containing protein [Microcoleus sp. FACHB-SPT15]MBD1807245.1 DUF4352 domain-containing protein [Microcoleus sp. FACHB-SPT15]